MKRLLLSGAFFAPLLMGLAVMCAGSAELDNRLPGRVANSTEASRIVGGKCGGGTMTCQNCEGNEYDPDKTNGDGETQSGGGCASDCQENSYSSNGCGA